jgi:hypothetical protein
MTEVAADEPPGGPGAADHPAGRAEEAADGGTAEERPKPADSGAERARAHRDDAAAQNGTNARAGAEEDESAGYDPEEGRNLRRERVQGKHLFSGTAFRSRMAGDTSGQTTLGDGSPAVGVAFGDVIGTVTTVNIGVGGRAHLVRKVDRDQVTDDGMFVECGPPGATVVEQLVQQLVDGRLVVLTGKPGSGRTTSAVRGLHRVLPSTSEIAFFTLGSRTQLHEMDLKPDNGYVVDIGPALERRSLPDILDDIRGHTGDRRTRGVHIVVIVDCSPSAAASAKCPVVDQSMPDRRELLELLLVRVHGLRSEDVRRLGKEVHKAIAHATVEEIVVAAAAVATALREGEPAHAYLRQQVRDQIEQKFDEPLADDPTETDAGTDAQAARRLEQKRTYRRCMLLSAAVLDGFSLHEVTDAAAELVAILYEDVPDAETSVFRFELPARQLLGWLDAEELTASEATSAGRLEFRNRAVPDVVVEYVWTSHHLAVDTIIRWLDGMARIRRGRPRPSREVRLRAAQVVGRLASYDFAYVVHKVIQGWIGTDTVSGLQATSWAVEVMADDPRIAVATWEKVREWSKGRRQLRRAALIVYADSLRPEQAADALALVRRIGGLSSDLDYAVAAVLHSAVRVGSADEVFELLVGWLKIVERTRDRFKQLRFAGKVRVLSGLPAHLARTVVLLSVDDDDGTRTRFLEAGRGKPGFAGALAEIWNLALADPAVAGRAIEQLRSWLIAADADDGTAEVLQVLVADLGRRASLQRLLRFHGRRWIAEWRGTYPHADNLLRTALWPDEKAAS